MIHGHPQSRHAPKTLHRVLFGCFDRDVTVPTLCPPIVIQGLVAGYGDAPVLDGVDLVLERGRKILLLGPNGAGKTTLLRCILGLLPARSGTVRLWGADPADSRARTALIARCGVGLEAPRSAMKISSLEWARYHASLAGSTDPLRSAQQALDLWSIPDHRLVEDLSLGERQRLETSRALLHEPELLLLDEPTAHLDPGARDKFWTSLDRWCELREASVLVSTHQLEEAADRGDEWVVLGAGRILHRGASDAFLQDFPCTRRLILRTPISLETLQAKVSDAVLGANVLPQGPTANCFRLWTPAGRQDLPTIVSRLCADGIELLGIGEDTTSFRESYACCLGTPPPSRATLPVGPPRHPASDWATAKASALLHLRGLSREKRLLIPFAIMLGVLVLAFAWIPPGAFSSSLLALGAVLPGGLAAGLAADLVAGERDRRSLDTSLSLPVPFGAIVRGRALAILSSAIALSWISLAVLASVTGSASVELFPIAGFLAPGAMSFCVALGTWVSMRSQNVRTAAQLSTLATLPLIALVQSLPMAMDGQILPWMAGGLLLWVATALLGFSISRQLQPKRLSA